MQNSQKLLHMYEHVQECNENFQMQYATDLGFLLKSAQNYKKCTFLDNLRNITQEGNMKTRQVTPFFHLLCPL